jgi:cation:H+ antiporter
MVERSHEHRYSRMEIAWSILIFVCGLAVLYVGAEATLHGAVGVARRIGVSSLLIGLTLIAYGTSAPELAIDLTAAMRGKTDLAFGDLIGSNIANLGLIFGVAIIIRPIHLNAAIVRFEIPLLVLQAILVLLLSVDGNLSRTDGMVLLVLFGAVASRTIYRGIREKQSYRQQVIELTKDFEAEDLWKSVLANEQVGETDAMNEFERDTKPSRSNHAASGSRSIPLNLSLVLLGLFGLIAGAQLMVYGAVDIARTLGVSELTIGLTIVAVGTSLPELATAILASRRHESDIVIGNVAGSNLFNVGCVLGLVACIDPVEIRAVSLRWELPMLIAFSAFLLPLALRGGQVRRWVGWVYLTAFILFLSLQAIQN